MLRCVFCALWLTPAAHVKRISEMCSAFWGGRRFWDHVLAASKIVCNLCSITSSSRGHRQEAGWLNPSSTDEVSVLLQGTSKLVGRTTLRTLSNVIYTPHDRAAIQNAYEQNTFYRFVQNSERQSKRKPVVFYVRVFSTTISDIYIESFIQFYLTTCKWGVMQSKAPNPNYWLDWILQRAWADIS